MNARRILKGHVADEPRLLLVIQEERAVGDAADQMAALVGLEVAQRSHGTYYTIFPTSAPPLLLHHWGPSVPFSILAIKPSIFQDTMLSDEHGKTVIIPFI